VDAAAVVAGAVDPPLPMNVTPSVVLVSAALLVVEAAGFGSVADDDNTPPGPNVMAPEAELDAAAVDAADLGNSSATELELAAVGETTTGGTPPVELAAAASDETDASLGTVVGEEDSEAEAEGVG
jgi:hypothetical protein